VVLRVFLEEAAGVSKYKEVPRLTNPSRDAEAIYAVLAMPNASAA
jgi:hypothetical protein